VGRAHEAHWRDESDESRGVPSTSMGTEEQAAMNAGLHHRLLRQPGLFLGVFVPAGPRTPAAAARIGLVWRFGGHLVFSWGNTRCVEARQRPEDSTYKKNKLILI